MKLSIVTVNYNNAIGLKSTLASVVELKKRVDEIEVYVIDGGSTDQSLNIIDEFSGIITSFVSEKDDGIYDAMNKGLSLCKGDFVLFLNSGDYFFNFDDIDLLINSMKSNCDNVIFWSAKIKSDEDEWFFPSLDKCNNINSWIQNNLPNHQAMIFPREFYKLNNYDLLMKINSDADYKHRAISACGYHYIPRAYTNFEFGGISSQALNFKRYKLIIKDVFTFENKNNSGFTKYRNIIVHSCKYTIKLLLSNVLPLKYYILLLKNK